MKSQPDAQKMRDSRASHFLGWLKYFLLMEFWGNSGIQGDGTDSSQRSPAHSRRPTKRTARRVSGGLPYQAEPPAEYDTNFCSFAPWLPRGRYAPACLVEGGVVRVPSTGAGHDIAYSRGGWFFLGVPRGQDWPWPSANTHSLRPRCRSLTHLRSLASYLRQP